MCSLFGMLRPVILEVFIKATLSALQALFFAMMRYINILTFTTDICIKNL